MAKKKSLSSKVPTKVRKISPRAVPKPPSFSQAASTAESGPQFAESLPTPAPAKFKVKHLSDAPAYAILDKRKGSIPPIPFPPAKGVQPEPILHLEEVLGDQGPKIIQFIQDKKQIVFHALGDTGNTVSAESENTVTEKLVTDFQNETAVALPSFGYLLGDIVYSFGEAAYYYDQFYDPYRDYPAPLFALAGNHDGMVAPQSNVPSLEAFLENFCASGEPIHRTAEAGNLPRTAGIQPGVYFTLEAPFVRILALYSNALEDPGIISSQSMLKGKAKRYNEISDLQLDFLEAALKRVKEEKYGGALLIAVHHPPYVAIDPSNKNSVGKHGSSPEMLADIDRVCAKYGVWPHAFLSGHAHNYQRFTRYLQSRETPFVVCGNGGHAHTSLTRKGSPTLRVPMAQAGLSNGVDRVSFDSYDDQDYGYLRIMADQAQLRIEYHPASDGGSAKTPDDSITVDLKSHMLVHYRPIN